MSEEEKKAINLLKSYENKLVYEISDKDKKAVKIILNLIEKLQKEIKEKTTIIMAGAEKVKQLEKEIEENREALDFSNNEIIKLKDMLIEKDKKIKDLSKYVYDKDFISKDKIKEKIKAFQDVKKEIIQSENKLLRTSITYDIVRNDYCEKMLNQLLEEKK